jgi:excisionase family DNA binding protein
MSEQVPEKLYTPEEVAARLHLSRLTVMDHLRAGRLKGVKVGRFWRITEEDLAAFIQRPAPRATATGAEGLEAVDAIIDRALEGECDKPLLMEGYSTEHLQARREGA